MKSQNSNKPLRNIMAPVAKRTRRQIDEALLKEFQALKKRRTSSGKAPQVTVLYRTSSEDLSSCGSSSEEETKKKKKKKSGRPSSSRVVSSTRSPVSRKDKKRKIATWSSSESDYVEEAEDEEDDEAEMVQVKVENKYDDFGTFENPIVFGADEEDDDSESNGTIKDYEPVDKASSGSMKHSECGEKSSSGSMKCVEKASSETLKKTSECAENSSSGSIKCVEKASSETLKKNSECVENSTSGSVKGSDRVEKAETSTTENHKQNVAVNLKEEAEEEEKKEAVVNKDKVKIRQTGGPLTVSEIKKVLLNSIKEEDKADANQETVKKPNESEESSYCSDIESEEELKISDPQQEEIDDCYRTMNACLAFMETGEESWMADVEKGSNQEQLCNEGQHDLFLDEEIGVYCRLCGHVREEIKHYMPPFHNNPFAVSRKEDYCTYGNRGTKNLPYHEDPNIGEQHFKDGAEFDTTGTVWEIMPGLRDSLLPQQREAFEFIWKHVGGGTQLDELKGKMTCQGGGCLISHAPGTGKTRLAIAFLQTYMKFCKNSRPVVLAPASILLSWKKEFQKWKVDVPFLNLNEDDLSESEMSFGASVFGIGYLRNLDVMARRLIKLKYWQKHDSVLAVSYSLFPMLVDQDESLRFLLLETPGVLVLDEAHMPRNEDTQMFKVLKKVKTKKRILLSGTPFQNTFRELRNILCLVRKEFNNEIDAFKKSGVHEGDEGKIKDLKEKMKPFLHCCGNHVLLATLPGIVENNIYLEPSEHQKSLLKFEEEQRRGHLESNVNMTLISIHPMLLHCKDTKTDVGQELRSERWDLTESKKTRFLIRFIQISAAMEERVLVFSQYTKPLEFIKAILQSHRFLWREGTEIHLMNGSQDMETRKRTMDLFNKPRGKAKVMLASTKACSEGIELTGASRVVLLDVAWNPAVEKQAISRAFRMGQQKVVHVYHLIMTGNDSNKHMSQNKKNSFSNYMFSSSTKKSGDVPESSKPAYEDIILDQLREESIIHEATQVKPRDNFF